MCDLGERDVAAAGCNRQLAEPLEIRAVFVREAQDDADGAVARVELRRLCARQLGVEHLLDITRADAVELQLCLVKVDLHRLGFLCPVEMDVRRGGIACGDGGNLLCDAAHLVRCGGRDTQHDGEVGGRPCLDVLCGDAHARELVQLRLCNECGKLLALRGTVRRDDELGSIRRVGFDVDRQDEARRGAPDICGVVCDLVAVGLEDGGEHLCLALGRGDGCALRQGQLDEKLGAQRGREEGLLDVRKCGDGCREEEHRTDEDGGAVTEKQRKHAPKEPVEPALVGIVRSFRPLFHTDQIVAEERRNHDGDNPAEDECNADDGEETAAELARHAL